MRGNRLRCSNITVLSKYVQFVERLALGDKAELGVRIHSLKQGDVEISTTMSAFADL